MGICLLAFTMFSYYVIINGVEGLLYSITYIPLIIYVLGHYAAYVADSKKTNYEKIMLLIYAVVLGYALHGILNACMYYMGYGIPGTRRWQDFWSREIVPGTQHAAYFLPTFVAFFPALVYFKERKIEFMNRLKVAPRDIIIAEIADKLQNLLSDYELFKKDGKVGIATLSTTYEMNKWYYLEMLKIFEKRINNSKLLDRYKEIVNIYFKD